MRAFLLAAFALLLVAAPAGGQEQGKAAQTVKNDPGGLVVLELFSSQACIFCPAADSLFADLVQIDKVIGLACHVSYIDVDVGSLAKPFCLDRQSYYQSVLKGGPNYTPQLVINGAHDVIGYRLQEVSQTIREAAAADGVQEIKIARTENDNVFDVTLPEVKDPVPLEIWVALTDRPHDVTIAEGGNRGKHVVYKNIAAALESFGSWQGAAETLRMDLKLTAQHEGFVVLAQDQASGKVVAAGQFLFPETGTPEATKPPSP